MRITTRLSTAAESGFLSMPMMKHDGEYYMLSDGRLDEVTVRKELSGNPGILFSDNDTPGVLSMTVELLDRMKLSINRLMEKDRSVVCPRKGGKKTSAERRFDKGRYVFVRVDISRKANVIRVALSVANPFNVVGGAEVFASILAKAFAGNIVAIRDSLKEYSGNTKLELVEGNGCTGMFEESERQARRRVESERIAMCERRTASGYCSPCDFSCPHCKRGRCVEETE